MQVTALDITTPYNQVLALASQAIHNQDFSFDVDPSGELTGMLIYDDMGGAIQVEMDCIMFFEVYNLVIKAGGLSAEQKSIIDPIIHQLH